MLVGLCRERHPDVAEPGLLAIYPDWLRLKTELEMCLFERVQKGEVWDGANGIQELGSGALSTTHSYSFTIAWSVWVSADPKWQALGKSYGIPVLPTFNQEALEKCGGNVWIDVPSLSYAEQSTCLESGIGG